MIIFLEKYNFKKTKFYFMTAVLCSLLSFCVSLKGYCTELTVDANKPVVIVIDPGHGGDNNGTTENGFVEKEMDMITAQAMYDELKKYDDVIVYMTHTEDIDLSLAQRAEYAQNVDADFLFSIHYNASIQHEIYGAEVWVSCESPYTDYGYRFGAIHQQLMKEAGIYLRGVKTKINENGSDYYGILRECTKREIPSVIIEHCHVDQAIDVVFCDNKDKWIQFGKADATAVARYFGLSSSELNVDYSTPLYDCQPDRDFNMIPLDETKPDICLIEKGEVDKDTNTATIKVLAADYDSPLLYYRYSIDGGQSFTSWYQYPACDVFHNSYQDTFHISIDLPAGQTSKVILRVANMYDLYTDSNSLLITMPDKTDFESVVAEGSTPEPKEEDLKEVTAISEEQEKKTFYPFRDTQDLVPAKSDRQIWAFIILSLFVVLTCFIFIFVFCLLQSAKKRKHSKKRNNNMQK